MAFVAVMAMRFAVLAHAVSAQTTTAAAPKLNIPIPSLNLADAVLQDGTVTIPFLAQYIQGVYNFLLGIVGMVAAVLMIIGGFQYLTSAGDKAKISAGKKRITDALIGMVLVFGSYILLYTINPNLVTFQSLQLTSIKTSSSTDFISTLGSTTADTSVGIVTDTSAGGGTTTGGGQSGSSHVWLSGSCPFAYSPSDSKAGRLAFYQGIQSPGVVTATTSADKVVQIADLARVCGALLGSCGRTAGAINALAGVYDSSGPAWASCCLQEDQCKATCANYSGAKQRKCLEDAGNCNDWSKGRDIYSISQTQRLFMYGLRCDTENSSGWPKCPFSGPWHSASDNCVRSDCVNSQAEAVAKVSEFLGQGPALPNLQPGDRLVVYNGNVDLIGSHAIIFMGWSPNNPNVMQTINGTAGRPTFAGGSCIKQPCGSWPLYPVLYVWRP